MNHKKREVLVEFVDVPDAQARIDAAFDLILNPLLKLEPEGEQIYKIMREEATVDV